MMVGRFFLVLTGANSFPGLDVYRQRFVLYQFSRPPHGWDGGLRHEKGSEGNVILVLRREELRGDLPLMHYEAAAPHQNQNAARRRQQGGGVSRRSGKYGRDVPWFVQRT